MRPRHVFSVASHFPASMPLAPLKKSDDAMADQVRGWTKFRSAVSVVLAHLCIGGVYTFSLFTEPMSRQIGIDSPAPEQDWNVSSLIPIFSLTITVAGLTAAFTGEWAERVGPNRPIAMAGLFWGGGLMLAALGLHFHSLFVVYLGYGLVGGLGIGLAYAPPVAGLIRWFPKQKGFASGLVIMGFGGGALIASPLIRVSMEHFQCSKAQTDKCANGGSTGAVETLFILGACYLGGLLLAGYGFVPAPPVASSLAASDEFEPLTSSTASDQLMTKGGGLTSTEYVPAMLAYSTKQFRTVWFCLFVNASAGIAFLSAAKNILSDLYVEPLKSDAAFPATFIALLSVSNALGRIFFARLSDRIGTQTTFGMILLGSLISYLLMSILFWSEAAEAKSKGDMIWFVLVAVMAIALYGGGFAVAPAYLSDIFGAQEVGAIYSRLLTSWAAAGLFGPTCLGLLRRTAERDAIRRAIHDLVQTHRSSLQTMFGPFGTEEELENRPGVTLDALSKLPLEWDPKTSLYRWTFTLMVGLLGIGFVLNRRLRPVDHDLVRKVDQVGEIILTETEGEGA